jgi:tetratricopeptide (TPR) repeat protein
MPDDPEQTSAETDAAAEAEAPEAPEPVDPVERVRTGWREFWQVPALLGAAAVLLLGVAFAVATAPEPEFGPVLTQAEGLIEREDYRAAIDLLNARVYPETGEGGALTQRDRQRYHLAKARAIYWGQKKLEIDDDRNHVSIVREYLEAERQGVQLAPRDLAALADTYLSRGEIELALARIDAMPAGSNSVSEPVVRRAVALLLRPPTPDRARALGLLADVLADPDVTIGQRVWAVETQAGVRLDQGYTDETITRLLREIPRLTQAEAPDRARLHLLLARAYRLIGADRQAMDQVRMAASLSAPGDRHFPAVLRERALLEQRAGDTARARDTYAEIAGKHADSAAYPWAMLGLGETEALLGSHELSQEAYAALIDGYDALRIDTEPTRERVMLSVLERANESLIVGEPQRALRYASLAEKVVRGRPTPAPLLETVAVAHELAAEELVEGATTLGDPLFGLDPSTRVEVQRHLVAAATNRRLLAERFVLSDLQRYADSLWIAANLFDRAGDQREAVQAYKTFAEALPSDPRYAQARFGLAEALRAMGEFQAAAEAYKDLIAEKEGSAGVDIGAWADASYVPLAQAYIYDEDPSNDSEAERLLTRAVDGSMAGTSTGMFRDALVELALLYDRTGRSARAIEKLEEIIERYPGDPQIGLFTYRLAEAHRPGRARGPARPPPGRRGRLVRAGHRAAGGQAGRGALADRGTFPAQRALLHRRRADGPGPLRRGDPCLRPGPRPLQQRAGDAGRPDPDRQHPRRAGRPASGADRQRASPPVLSRPAGFDLGRPHPADGAAGLAGLAGCFVPAARQRVPVRRVAQRLEPSARCADNQSSTRGGAPRQGSWSGRDQQHTGGFPRRPGPDVGPADARPLPPSRRAECGHLDAGAR